MSTLRKKYDPEFRKEAIRLASEPGASASQIERELDLYQGAISSWKRQQQKDPEGAFPGNGRLKPADEEKRRLRRENERLRQERNILKKAAAYFSKDAIKDLRS